MFVDTVRVCASVPKQPRARCSKTVDVLVAEGEMEAAPDPAPATPTELNLIQSLLRTAHDTLVRRSRGHAPIMLYGIEPESVLAFYMKREMLLVLARLSGMGIIGRAAMGLTPTSSIRAIAEGESIEQSRIRATYIQIERLQGASPIIPSAATQGAFAATGAYLFASGLAAQKLIHNSLGDALTVHPMLWPIGIEISGKFSLP